MSGLRKPKKDNHWHYEKHQYHENPTYQRRNTFYWLTWELNKSGNNQIWTFYVIEKFSSKSSRKCVAWKLVSGPFMFMKH